MLFKQFHLTQQDLINVTNIPDGQYVDYDHSFNLGGLLSQQPEFIGLFSGSGLWQKSVGRLEISMTIKLVCQKSYVFTSLIGLRNYLGEPGDEPRVTGIDFTLPPEDTSTLESIDAGIKFKGDNQYEEIKRYTFAYAPYIIEANFNLRYNYKLMLNTRLSMQTSQSNLGPKDIKAIVLVKYYP